MGVLVRGLGTTMRGHGRWDSPSLGTRVRGLSTTMRGYGNWGGVSDFQKGNVGRRSGLVHTTRIMTRSPRGRKRGLWNIAWTAGYNTTLSHHFHTAFVVDLGV